MKNNNLQDIVILELNKNWGMPAKAISLEEWMILNKTHIVPVIIEGEVRGHMYLGARSSKILEDRTSFVLEDCISWVRKGFKVAQFGRLGLPALARKSGSFENITDEDKLVIQQLAKARS